MRKQGWRGGAAWALIRRNIFALRALCFSYLSPQAWGEVDRRSETKAAG
jgi:hypothetical protein